jgi:RNA polymerase sigma-70 factor (ECF subfamily)
MVAARRKLSVVGSSEADVDDLHAVSRCRAGSPDAFRSIVERHQRRVISLIARLTGHGPHVEDLAQETFLAAYRAIHRFELDGPAKLSTWLLTIATRHALDYCKRRRVDILPLRDGMDVATAGTPESQLADKQATQALYQAISSLNNEQRVVWILTQEEGLSHAEVAAVVGQPPLTVKMRLFHARQRLRQLLATSWRSR